MPGVIKLQNPAQAVIENAIERHPADAGALFEHEVLTALASVKSADKPAWQRLRAKLRKLEGLPFAELEREVRRAEIDADGGGSGGQADRLAAICREQADLFHDENRVPFAEITVDGHREVLSIQSNQFRDWLSGEFYRQTGGAARAASLSDALSALTAAAVFCGEQHRVHLRVAKYGEQYVIDLADADWRVVVVDASGWQVVDESPVKFRRTENMRPLPEPVAGGDLSKLWQHVNVPEPSRLLVLGWLLECFRPDVPFPVLELIGEQGSAKSTTHERLRELVDPNSVNLRAAPKSAADVFVASRNSHVVSYNNLSHLGSELQDNFCTLATGGGFATRQLYTNGGESLIEAKRPLSLNGISTLVTAPDLLERTVRVLLPRIAVYRSEAELKAAWQSDRGEIFGGLLDLFALTLAKLPAVEIDRPPRMADFGNLGEAMSAALGRPGEFLEAHAANQRDAIRQSLEQSPAALALLEFVQSGRTHNGTFGQLFESLERHRPVSDPAWPKTPRGLSDIVRRFAPALRALGVAVTFHGHTRRGNVVEIFSAEKKTYPDARSHASQRSQDGGQREHCEDREHLSRQKNHHAEKKSDDRAVF
ncbi:hypothetical protein Q4485_02950 [Granulosicoccaceae sp. 1_MG-2023]|nr:hypothetical protein [Granulosicoccaceae sp. 1_MG-2023]